MPKDKKHQNACMRRKSEAERDQLYNYVRVRAEVKDQTIMRMDRVDFYKKYLVEPKLQKIIQNSADRKTFRQQIVKELIGHYSEVAMEQKQKGTSPEQIMTNIKEELAPLVSEEEQLKILTRVAGLVK